MNPRPARRGGTRSDATGSGSKSARPDRGSPSRQPPGDLPGKPPGNLIVSKEKDEELVRPTVGNLDESERDRIYEEAKLADHQLSVLQALSMSELIGLGLQEGLDNTAGLGKQELIFRLLKRRVTSTGLGWGEGVLDVLPDGFGFLRSKIHSYSPGPDDIYVSPSQIRRLNLRPGHVVAGPVRPPKDGERYFALLHVEAVDGGTVEDLRRQIPFDELTPLLPNDRLWLDHPGCGADARMLEFLAPIGKGQRVLLRTPPLSGRGRLLTNLARGILHNHPEVYVILLVIDEQPEEVTEMARQTGPGERREVAASTFDEPASRHVTLAEIVTEKARRLVEAGRDVVILMDSLTQLTRAYNQELPHSGKILSSGLDVGALHKPKWLFGSARNIEEGGSLTVIATVLTDTGSPMNDVICEEFQGKANSEIVLDEHLADLHFYPALDVSRTRTRREDNLLAEDEQQKVHKLRRLLGDASPQAALEQLLEMIAQTESNQQLLLGL